MDALEKFQVINKCETADQLATAILAIATDGIIQGRLKEFGAVKMAARVQEVINGTQIPNVLIREFGIRQQALYIKYYEQEF